MGDPKRLRMLQRLEAGESSASALAQSLEATQPNISKHLKLLQEAGLVSRRQQGNSDFYAIADPMAIELYAIIC